MTAQQSPSSWLRPALILFISAIFGLFVIPQLGSRVQSNHPLIGLPAPDFSLPILDPGETNNRIRLSALTGHVVVLDFWASWCQPCTIQSQILRRVAELPASKSAIFVGINTADEPARARRALLQHPLPYSSVLDTDAIADQYGAFTLPTVVIVDKYGVVSQVASRVMGENELVEAIAEAVARPEPAVTAEL